MRGILTSAATVSTNPDPNSLGTVNPFPTPYVNEKTVSAAWISQAVKALFPFGARESAVTFPIKIGYVPSTITATYSINIWEFDSSIGIWLMRADIGTKAYPPAGTSIAHNYFIDFIPSPDIDAIYIQVAVLSAGTLKIIYNSGLAVAQ